jgi:hypothetical protein
MKHAVCLVLLLTIASLALFAQNHMNLAMSIFGDQDFDHFGDKMASLDFNGDGYDDLAVLQSWWVPDSIYVTIPYGESDGRDYGRILFYYGGPGFDGVADFTIEGTRQYQFHFSKNYMYSLGDVNGDGFEDLGILEHFPKRLDVFFGGTNPSTAPGHIINIENPSIEQAHFYELGDINGDGYDDFGLWTSPSYSHTGYMSIILGGTFQQIIFDSTSEADASGLHAIGDINNDGYDDFCYTIFRQRPTRFHSKLIYYGSSDLNNSLQFPYVIVPDYTESATVVAKAVGDVNNDGYDDFIGLMTGYGQRLWLGGITIGQDWDVLLNPPYAGLTADHCTVNGDFNGDGFSDIIGADFILEEAALWLGGSNMNGTPDLFLYGISTGFQFGVSMASGDFNDDGYDDVAIGEPSLDDDIFHGRIRIYTGNAQLADTTVAVDDGTNTPPLSNWWFRAIPNPSLQGTELRINFSGSGYDSLHNAELRVYNIKGQLEHKQQIPADALKSGEFAMDKILLSGGVHLVAIYEDGQKLKTEKVTIK